jgi:hypothetical protein
MQEEKRGIRDSSSNWDTIKPIFVTPKKVIVAVLEHHSIGFNQKPTYWISAAEGGSSLSFGRSAGQRLGYHVAVSD